MKLRKAAIYVLCLMMLVAMMAGCGNDGQSTDATGSQQAGNPEGETSTEATEFKDIVISTPYGELHYHEQWEEFLRIQQVTEGNSVKVAFCAEINGNMYPLFEVIIGEGQGDQAGQLTDANGTVRDVHVVLEENIEHSELTDEEQNRIYAMQEDINYVIENLK